MLPKEFDDFTEIGLMKAFCLFLAPLNNGDWMAGRACLVYSLTVVDDHYKDSRLSIDRHPRVALERAATKVFKIRVKGGDHG